MSYVDPMLIESYKKQSEAYMEGRRKSINDANPEEWNAAFKACYSSAKEQQVGGDHYKKQAIQPIEYIQANGLGFLEGNAIKYITRYKDKGGKEDIEKAIHYLELLWEQLP